MPGFRKFSRRPRRKILRRRRVFRKKVPKAVKRFVKNAIHRQVENKEWISYATNQSMTCGSSIGAALIPNLTQGVANNQRVGNQIKIVSGYIKGKVNLLPYNVTTNTLTTPQFVRIAVIRQIDKQAETVYSSAINTNLLFKGNGTALPIQGNVLDQLLPYNDDLIKVYADKKFKLGAASYSSAGQVGSSGYFDNSPMSINFYFNWGKYVKKMLKYDESSNYPSNSNLYIQFIVSYPDGSSSTQTPLEAHWVNFVKFEDA